MSDVRRQRDDDLRGEAGSGSESQIATGLLAGEERSAPSPSSDPIRDALIRCLDAYEAHDRWCGHNPDAPGDERLQAFQDAYRVLAEPSVVGTPSSDTVTVDRDDTLRAAAEDTALTCPAADTEWSGLDGCDVRDKFGNKIATARDDRTARFIALADPPTVLSLLARLRAALAATDKEGL